MKNTIHKILKRILAISILTIPLFLIYVPVEAAIYRTFADECGVSDFLKTLNNNGNISLTGSSFTRFTYNGSDEDGKYISQPVLVINQNYRATYNPDGSTKGAIIKTDSGSYSTVNVSQPYTFAIEQYLNPGQHKYTYKMPTGSIIPVGQWTPEYTSPSYPCCHSEGFIETDFIVGRWAEYHGIEYHSVSGTLASENELISPCVSNGANRWFPRCAVCGEVLSYCHFLAPDSALRDLKYLVVGDQIINLCSYCGGMEATGSIYHSCKAISDNRYHIVFDAGTNDPNVYGSETSLTWYHNYDAQGNANYEHQPVKGATRIPATTGFIRPGYTFAGWSYTKNGTILASGCPLSKIESDKGYPANDTTITLYAVWKAEETTVTINANTENSWNGTATVFGNSSYTENKTFHTGRIKGSDSLSLDNANNFTPNSFTVNVDNDVVLPVGYTLSFNANGGVVKDYTTGNTISTLSAPVYCIGFNRESHATSPAYTVGSNGRGIITNETYDGDILKTFTYKYNGAPYTETITLQYKQGSLKLPSCSKSDSLFTGWYTDPTYKEGTYVGTTGDYYFPTQNITLYARFSEINIEVTDAYYRLTSDPYSYNNLAVLSNGLSDNNYKIPSDALAINYAKGAFYFRNKMFVGGGNNLVYETYYRLSNTNDPFTKLDGNWQEEGSTAVSLNKIFATAGVYTHEVLSTGYYTLTVDGAQGQDYGSYTGGKGGEVSGIYFLEKGDILTITVGSRTDGSGNTAYASGGGLSQIDKTHNGTTVTLLVAGGGGGAGSLSNGNDGGNTDPTTLTTTTSGKSGASAGGSGYLGGLNGTYTIHTHGSNTGGAGVDTTYYYDGTTATTNTTNCYSRHQGSHRVSCPGHAPIREYVTTSGISIKCPYCKKNTTQGGRGDYEHYIDCDGHWHDIGQVGTWEAFCMACGHSLGPWNNGGSHGTQYCGGKNESYDYYALDHCPYQNSDNNFVISAYGAFGGSNYVSTEGVITSSVTNLTGKHSGEGSVTIDTYNVSLRSGKDNEAFDVFFASDKTAPEKVNISLTVRGGSEYITVDSKPDSGRTNYDIYTVLYEVTPDTATGLTFNQQSPVLTCGVMSAIAGYYYYYTDDATFDLADYIKNTLNYTDLYTYSDKHCTEVGFSYHPTFEVITDKNYVHVAAVDVAGNIGLTSTLEVGQTKVVKVIFDANSPVYQIHPITLDGSTVPVARYIAKDGATIPDNGKGRYENLSHLHFNNIPTVNATGLTHTGWVNKETGETYNTTLTGFKPQEDMTLYATYDYTTTGSLEASYTIQKNNINKGVTVVHGVPIALNTESYNTTSDTTPWANTVIVKIKGKDEATGLYSLDTYNAFNTTVFQGNKDYLAHQRTDTSGILLGENISYALTGADVVTDNYSDEDIFLQGHYTISGEVITREGNVVTTNDVNIKVDKTMPTFEYFTIKKKNLTLPSANPSDITSAVKNAITSNGFSYTFKVTVNDYNSDKYGKYTAKEDSSGLYGVYVSVTDGNNDTNFAVYKMNQDIAHSETLIDSHVLRADYSITLNLKSRFPDATKLVYRIYAVDNAGNITETTNLIENTYDNNGHVIIDHSLSPDERNTYIEQIGHSTIFGTIDNGEIITALYAEESAELNQLTDDGITPTGFFRIGDFGHIDIWTVGYVKTITWDFDANGDDILGTESMNEILTNKIHAKYNMGLANTPEYKRSISYNDTYDNLVFEIIEPDFFIVEEGGVETKICKSPAIATSVGGTVDVAKYNSLLINSDGVPYAMHITVTIPSGKSYSDNFENTGTSVRIPPYYQLTTDPVTGEYVWETHFYHVIGTFENGNTCQGAGKYVLFGDRSTDVHQRVTKYYSNN